MLRLVRDYAVARQHCTLHVDVIAVFVVLIIINGIAWYVAGEARPRTGYSDRRRARV